MSTPKSVIKSVRLTEKATILGEALNQYVFQVSPSASKDDVRREVEAVFGKKVVSVNTSNFLGKARRKRTVSAGKTSDWKKAIVTLAAGQKIELA